MIKILKITFLFTSFVLLSLVSTTYANDGDMEAKKKDRPLASHFEILREFKAFRDAQAKLLGKKASAILLNESDLASLVKSSNYFPKPRNGYCECSCKNEKKIPISMLNSEETQEKKEKLEKEETEKPAIEIKKIETKALVEKTSMANKVLEQVDQVPIWPLNRLVK